MGIDPISGPVEGEDSRLAAAVEGDRTFAVDGGVPIGRNVDGGVDRDDRRRTAVERHHAAGGDGSGEERPRTAAWASADHGCGYAGVRNGLRRRAYHRRLDQAEIGREVEEIATIVDGPGQVRQRHVVVARYQADMRRQVVAFFHRQEHRCIAHIGLIALPGDRKGEVGGRAVEKRVAKRQCDRNGRREGSVIGAMAGVIVLPPDGRSMHRQGVDLRRVVDKERDAGAGYAGARIGLAATRHEG